VKRWKWGVNQSVMTGPISCKTRLTLVAIVYHKTMPQAAQHFLRRATRNCTSEVKGKLQDNLQLVKARRNCLVACQH
jgi:hypothetical protein